MIYAIEDEDPLLLDIINIIQMGVSKAGNSKVMEYLKESLNPIINQNKILKQKNSKLKKDLIKKDHIIEELCESNLLLTRQSSSNLPAVIDTYSPIIVSKKTKETDVALENIIFRVNIPEGELDMQKLRQWINDYFIKRYTYQYDWFGLWRVLKDKGLIRNTQVSTRSFVKQMSRWFPDMAGTCKDGSINLYRSGYLGKTEFCAWNQALFEDQMKEKQRLDGFTRLKELCGDLYVCLKKDLLIKK